MGILDPTIAHAFDIECGLILEEHRTKQRLEAEERQLEVLAAATNVSLQSQVTEAVT